MAKVLSQEEIDNLLDSVVDGKDDSGTESLVVKKKVTVYDFKRPHLISKEQFRLLNNIHEALVRKIAVFLSAQLRMIIELELIGIDQIMYSEFVMSISSPGAIYVGEIDNPYSQFILECSPQLVALTVERLFGGQGTYMPATHTVSVIERKIMEKIVQKIAEEISENWKSIKEFNCEFKRFEHNAEFVQIVPASEPVVVSSIEIKLRGITTMLNICYPYVWISNVLSNPEIQRKIMFGSGDITDEQKELMYSNLNSTDVNITAVLGKSQISVKECLDLKVGDVLRLDTKIKDDIALYASNKGIYMGVVGKKDNNYAVKITEIREDE